MHSFLSPAAIAFAATRLEKQLNPNVAYIEHFSEARDSVTKSFD
jgi:hypothetical protein